MKAGNKQETRINTYYAQFLILVNLLLVNLFSFLVIKSSHGSYEGCHLVEILPTGLPDLSKPSKSTKNLKKH